MRDIKQLFYVSFSSKSKATNVFSKATVLSGCFSRYCFGVNIVITVKNIIFSRVESPDSGSHLSSGSGAPVSGSGLKC